MRLFITGGTGSLGTRLLEHAQVSGWRATAYSRDEVKQSLLKRRFPDVEFVLGDIRDTDWMAQRMLHHDVVVHTAAYKQIPSAEVNSGQAISVNVNGSIAVASAALRAGVERVVGISTDKACAPVNCYGATKMLMEKLFQEADNWGETQFNLVRYGNVLGSRGSVVPFFREQAKTGTLTLTNPDMTRFWMTIEDALQIVLDAMFEAEPATILVPKCKATSMYVMAYAIAPDATMKIIGTRPGEKVHEQLTHAAEAMHTIDIGGYFRVYPATKQIDSNLPIGFEYTSANAPHYTLEQLRSLLENV